MHLSQFNILSIQDQKEKLFKCCASAAWVEKLADKFPFASMERLKNESDKIWFSLTEKDWLEAFAHHPKIGDIQSLGEKFADTRHWASGEQAGVNAAEQGVLEELIILNERYEMTFGYIFIVCATGKSAEEMLELLKARMQNTPREEIKIAMQEQNKITHIRIDKLFA